MYYRPYWPCDGGVQRRSYALPHAYWRPLVNKWQLGGSWPTGIRMMDDDEGEKRSSILMITVFNFLSHPNAGSVSRLTNTDPRLF